MTKTTFSNDGSRTCPSKINLSLVDRFGQIKKKKTATKKEVVSIWCKQCCPTCNAIILDEDILHHLLDFGTILSSNSEKQTPQYTVPCPACKRTFTPKLWVERSSVHFEETPPSKARRWRSKITNVVSSLDTIKRMYELPSKREIVSWKERRKPGQTIKTCADTTSGKPMIKDSSNELKIRRVSKAANITKVKSGPTTGYHYLSTGNMRRRLEKFSLRFYYNRGYAFIG